MRALLLLLALGYPWLAAPPPQGEALADRIPPPPGFERRPLAPDSFGDWLRHLPLEPGHPPVRLYDGRLKGNQRAHAAVVAIDTGDRDLQQCADAVIRLRAEYLFARGRGDEIAFNFTNGDRVDFARWARGDRPVVRGHRSSWTTGRPSDASHASLRRYLDTIFTYAGSRSLAEELTAIPLDSLEAGNVFIQGGSPGHAVLVVDTADDPRSGRRAFLLAQSYMPAQQIHILRNPARTDAWYILGDATGRLVTPEWTFPPGSLRCF